jgi:copper transport protein
VLAVTGTLQLNHQVGSVAGVVDSEYGNLLLAKICLLLPLLALGAFNLVIVRNRFRRAAATGQTADKTWEQRFRGAVAIEVAVAIVVLVLTAVLTTGSPPTTAAGDGGGGGAEAPPDTQIVNDLRIHLDVYPGRVGSNDISVFLSDQDGDPREIQRVALRFRYLEQDLGQTESDAEQAEHEGHYELETSQMSLPGTWEIEVLVRRQGLFDARAKFNVEISG